MSLADYSSAYSSRQTSREQSPIPNQIHHHFHIPRFWRGYILGGLSTAGLFGLGAFAKRIYHNKFKKSTPTPTPAPTPKLFKPQKNYHY